MMSLTCTPPSGYTSGSGGLHYKKESLGTVTDFNGVKTICEADGAWLPFIKTVSTWNDVVNSKSKSHLPNN